MQVFSRFKVQSLNIKSFGLRSASVESVAKDGEKRLVKRSLLYIGLYCNCLTMSALSYSMQLAAINQNAPLPDP